MRERTKQINITVPRDMEHIVELFDRACKEQQITRSEAVLSLMTQYATLTNPKVAPTPEESLKTAPEPLQSDLPGFLT